MTTSGDLELARRRTAQAYREFAESWTAGRSAVYGRLCAGVADDAEVVEFLVGRPERERQPNLLLAAVRWLFGVIDDPGEFRTLLLEHRDAVAGVMSERRTQTNEPARCAGLLPILAALPGPLALLEIGAAAGLCLLPDRYAYRYRSGGAVVAELGSSPAVFECEVRGPVPLPPSLPEIAWRRGIDLAPIDVRDDEQVRWLETLIWPGEHRREEQLRAAVEVARADPPEIVRGDLLDALPEVAATAPPDATLVVVSTAVLMYLDRERRALLRERAGEVADEWIAAEAPRVLPDLADLVPPGRERAGAFVVTRNGEPPVALMDSHGAWVEWL